MNIINKVIVSSDTSPMFLNYWPVITRSWKNIFHIPVTLVLVAPNNFNPSIIAKLREFGAVKIIEELNYIPKANQAKLARWFYACQQKTSIVSIEDIDTLFLKSDFLDERMSEFEPAKLLGIGSEVYKSQESLRKFPASNFTGSGHLFAKLFGYYEGMTFSNFVNQFNNLRVFDNLEDPFRRAKYFSDESLIRALRLTNNFNDIKIIQRNIDIRTRWLDRSWWPVKDELDISQYTTVNFLRPLRENFESCRKVVEIFFQGEYPWILDKKTPIYLNKDHKIRRIFQNIEFGIQKRLHKLNTHQFNLLSKFRS